MTAIAPAGLWGRPLPPKPEIEMVLDDCGHVPMWDDPEAVASALLTGSSIARVAP